MKNVAKLTQMLYAYVDEDEDVILTEKNPNNIDYNVDIDGFIVMKHEIKLLMTYLQSVLNVEDDQYYK